jgi:hypothetical protein
MAALGVLVGNAMWTTFYTVPSDSVAVVQRFGAYLKDVPAGLRHCRKHDTGRLDGQRVLQVSERRGSGGRHPSLSTCRATPLTSAPETRGISQQNQDRAEDVDGGAALTFTTTGEVAELRHRVAHRAEMHAKHHGEGHGGRMGAGAREGMMGGGAHEGMMVEHKGRMMPPSTARSEEVEGGARLIITPRDPADLAKLREHAREHAEKMASGQCPMMAMHGHGDESATGEHGPHEGHHPGHKD